MPKYNNQFARPEYIDHAIVNEHDRVVGTLRVKPVSISWKPAGQHNYYSVPLSDFTAWITNPATKARRNTR